MNYNDPMADMKKLLQSLDITDGLELPIAIIVYDLYGCAARLADKGYLIQMEDSQAPKEYKFTVSGKALASLCLL